MKLLGFVALYGFILAPFGAIIVFEHFFAKKIGITKNYAEVAGITFNKSVFYAWLISFGIFYFISIQFDVFLSFVTLPAWLLCGILFLVFSKYYQKPNVLQKGLNKTK
jgi:NCS1 family nucleobase:cation symporter-1